MTAQTMANPADPALCVVYVEGVEVTFRWNRFRPGSSVFIPCIDTASVVKQVKASAKHCPFKVHVAVGVRDGRYGVGIWRVV